MRSRPEAVASISSSQTPDRCLADFEKVAFKDEVRPLILKENALRLLGLK